MFKNTLLALSLVVLLAACDITSMLPQNQSAFADQGFKTWIALVELHYLRNGEYPSDLDEIQHMGEWDPIYKEFIDYKKHKTGYELNVRNQELAKDLRYPYNFWIGLGILSTNVEGFSPPPGAERKPDPGPITIQEARKLGATIEVEEDFVTARGKRIGFIHYKMSLNGFTGCPPEKVVAQAFTQGTSLLNARLGTGDDKYEFSVDIERPGNSRFIIFCKSGDRAGYVVEL